MSYEKIPSVPIFHAWIEVESTNRNEEALDIRNWVKQGQLFEDSGNVVKQYVNGKPVHAGIKYD